MKKFIGAVIAIAFVSFALVLIFYYFHSDGRSEKGTDASTEAYSLVTETVFLSDHGTSNDEPESGKITVETEHQSDEAGFVTLKYPHLDSLADFSADSTVKLDVINKALRDSAFDNFYDKYSGEDGASYVYEVTDCKFYASGEKVVSSVSNGYLNVENSAHESAFKYSVNIDADSGSMYSFHDIIIDWDGFTSAFKSGRFTLAEGNEDVVTDLGWEYLIGQYSDEYEIFPDVYFDGDLLGVIVEVPYAAGSYASFTINKSELRNIIAPEFS